MSFFEIVKIKPAQLLNKFCFINRGGLLLIPVFLTISSLYISAQNYLPEKALRKFSVDEGLSDNSVNVVVRDKLGFLWIGTQNGLNRFDGYNFIHFKHDPANQNSLPDNCINTLVFDNAGNLCIGTNNGLSVFNPAAETFTNYGNLSADTSSNSDIRINALYIDSPGNIWIGTRQGDLICFDSKTKSFTSYNIPYKQLNGAGLKAVFGITGDCNHQLWIRTTGELFQFDITKKAFTSPGIQLSSENQTCSLYIDNSDNLWVAGINGLQKINILTGNPEPLHPQSGTGLIDQRFHLFSSFTGNEILAAGKKGLFRINTVTNEITQITNTIFNDSVRCIYNDKAGIIWFGTKTGLVQYNSYAKKFTLWQHDANNPNTITGSTIRAIFVDSDKNIWVGSTDGDCTERINRTTNKITRYYYNPGNPYSIASNTTTCFSEDNEGNLWIGSGNRGISILKKGETDRFKTIGHIESRTNTLRNNWVQDIYIDKFGTVWIGNETGLDLYNPVTKQYRPIVCIPNDNSTITPYAVQSNCIIEDIRGNFWVGTYGGITLMIPNDRNKSTFETEYKFIRFPINSLISMHYDPQNPNVIYAGALLNKLYKISIDIQHPENSKIETFSVSKDFPQSAVYGILSDSKGNLWVSTDWGLFNFDTKTNTSRPYLAEDGLQDNRFNWGAYFKSTDGELFFGGANGFNSFYPEEIVDDTITPKVLFTNLRIFNNPVKIGQKKGGRVILSDNISYTGSLELSHRDKVFSIEFAGVNYSQPEKISYKYKLEGFDNDWLYSESNNRIVTYTNLKPGKYIFKVNASNSDGVWNTQESSLKIIIHPPWWGSWFAIVIYGLLFLAGLVLFYYYQFLSYSAKHQSELRKVEKQKKEEINQFRLNFFTNISHEFRTPLTLIEGPLEEIIRSNYQMKVTEKFVPIIKRNTEILLSLVNEIMDFRKLETGKMLLAAENTNIIEFITEHTKSFDEIAKKKNIGFRIGFEPNLPDVYIDREAFRKILYNLLSNAIKFTNENGTVVLSVSKNSQKSTEVFKNQFEIVPDEGQPEEFVEISVEDNGIGISENAIGNIFDSFNQDNTTRKNQGSGLGLAITRQLVLLHKGSLMVQSTPGYGSRFTVRLPLGKLHLTPNQVVDSNISVQKAKTDTVGRLANGMVVNDYRDDFPEPDFKKGIKPLILLVEDNDDMRRYIIEGLRDKFLFIEAATGIDGLEKAKKTNPGLIISDVMLPEMDGKELCYKLKNDIHTSHIPIILLTALSSTQNVQEGYTAGADLYISKPFDFSLLKVQVKNLLDNRNKIIRQFKNEPVTNIGELEIGNIDKDFLIKIEKLITDHLTDPHINVDFLCKEIGLGKKTLQKKLKFLTGFSPGEYIDSIRLNHALELLKNSQLNSSEIAYRTGFSSPSYFARCFRKKFNISPKDYSRKQNK